jgi:hypothetical protein
MGIVQRGCLIDRMTDVFRLITLFTWRRTQAAGGLVLVLEVTGQSFMLPDPTSSLTGART